MDSYGFITYGRFIRKILATVECRFTGDVVLVCVYVLFYLLLYVSLDGVTYARKCLTYAPKEQSYILDVYHNLSTSQEGMNELHAYTIQSPRCCQRSCMDVLS